MVAFDWHGAGDYDLLLRLTGEEMGELTRFYGIGWSFFTTGPRKNFDNEYFCFFSSSRRALALLPFLSLAFGGQYDELPFGDAAKPITIDYSQFRLEEFSF